MESSRPRSGASDLTAAARSAHEKITGAISTICKVYKYGSFSEQCTNSTDCASNEIPPTTDSPHPQCDSRDSISISCSSSTPQPSQPSQLPFSKYTPHPHLGVLPNDSINDGTLRLNNDFYINSIDDVSVTSCNSSTAEVETDTPTPGMSHRHPLGLVLVDASSNWSVPEYHHQMSNTSSKSRSCTNTHSLGNIQCTSSSGTTTDGHSIGDSDYVENDNPLLGMMLMTISALLHTTLNMSVKTLMYQTAWQELMFVRMGITWILSVLWIVVRFRGEINFCGPSSSKFRILLFLRALFLWGSMFCCWWSFEFIPVADGMTLAMVFPVWVYLFSHCVYRPDYQQKRDWLHWICVIAGLVGIAFVGHPTFLFSTSLEDEFATFDLIMGTALGVVSGIFAAAQYLIVNYTKDQCHWTQVEQTTAALGTFIFCPLAAVSFMWYGDHYLGDRFYVQFDKLSAVHIFEETGLGILGFLAMVTMTRAAQLDAVGRTAICLYFQIPFMYIGQFYEINKRSPNPFVFMGMFLVLCAVIVPAIRRWRNAVESQKEESELSVSEETVSLLGIHRSKSPML